MSAPSPDAASPAVPRAVAAQGNGAAAAVNNSDRSPGDEPGVRRTPGQVATDILLFFAAPFVTLAYLAMFPFVGIMTLVQASRQRKESA